MPGFGTRVVDGWRWALDHPTFVLAPLLTAFLSDNVARVLSFRGWTVGLTTGLPSPISDVWRFVNVPAADGVVAGPVPLVVLGVVLRAVVLAGYLGSMRSTLASGRSDLETAVRRYTLPMLAYLGAIFLVGVAAIAVGLAFGTVGIVLLFPAVVALKYLFFATPFLLVLRREGLEDALRRSAHLALDGGPYLRFALAYAGLVLLASPLATLVVVNLGLVGVVVGAVVGAPVGLALDVATMRFVADLGDHEAGYGDRRAPTVSWP